MAPYKHTFIDLNATIYLFNVIFASASVISLGGRFLYYPSDKFVLRYELSSYFVQVQQIK